MIQLFFCLTHACGCVVIHKDRVAESGRRTTLLGYGTVRAPLFDMFKRGFRDMNMYSGFEKIT
jgi:hypothetical protein